MSYFSIVLSQIIGFVIYLLIGMVAVHMHVLDSRSLGVFSQFITKVSMPLLLFTNTLNGATRQQFISALPILAAPVVACLLVLYDEWQRTRQPSSAADGRSQLTALLGIPVALLIALVFFFVTSPYALLDWRSFLQATLPARVSSPIRK